MASSNIVRSDKERKVVNIVNVPQNFTFKTQFFVNFDDLK